MKLKHLTLYSFPDTTISPFYQTDIQEKSKGSKSQDKSDSPSMQRTSSDSNMSTSSQSNISQTAAALSQVCFGTSLKETTCVSLFEACAYVIKMNS